MDGPKVKWVAPCGREKIVEMWQMRRCGWGVTGGVSGPCVTSNPLLCAYTEGFARTRKEIFVPKKLRNCTKITKIVVARVATCFFGRVRAKCDERGVSRIGLKWVTYVVDDSGVLFCN